MADGSQVYYKVRDVVRQKGHSESESCRVYKDWHIELRVGSGHVSVWTSQGMVFLTMLDKPVHYLPGAWEEHLSRLHLGRPLLKPSADLRELLRAQAMESDEEDSGEVRPSEQPDTNPSASAPRNADSSSTEHADFSSTGATGDPKPASPVDETTETPALNDSAAASGQEPVNGRDSLPDEDSAYTEPPKRDYVFSDTVILIDEDDTGE